MTINDTKVDTELLAFAHITVFLVEGTTQCELPSGLKSMIYASLKVLKAGISEERINQIISLIPYINKNEAYNEIVKLSDENRIKIAGALVGFFVNDESRFQEVCVATNLPLELVNGEIKKAKKHVYCITCGTKIYCFASRDDAEQGAKIISDNEICPAVRSQLQICEQMKPIDYHTWTLASLKSSLALARGLAQREHGLHEWYSQPAFISNDVSAWLDSMVERKQKGW